MMLFSCKKEVINPNPIEKPKNIIKYHPYNGIKL